MDTILFGILAADMIVDVKICPIDANERLHTKEALVNPGGVSVVAIGCARLGLKPCLLGTRADDWVGNQICKMILQESVVVKPLASMDRTPIVYSFVDGDGAYAKIVEFGYL